MKYGKSKDHQTSLNHSTKNLRDCQSSIFSHSRQNDAKWTRNEITNLVLWSGLSDCGDKKLILPRCQSHTNHLVPNEVDTCGWLLQEVLTLPMGGREKSGWHHATRIISAWWIFGNHVRHRVGLTPNQVNLRGTDYTTRRAILHHKINVIQSPAQLTSLKLTYPLKMMVSNKNLLFQAVIQNDGLTV